MRAFSILSGNIFHSSEIIIKEYKYDSSKMKIYTALPHDSICHIAWFYFFIYRKVLIVDGTMPNIMVAFAVTHKATPILPQYLTDFFLVLCHYTKTIFSCLFILNSMDSRLGNRFNSIISGATFFTRSMRLSRESDSNASGISSQTATQTLASSSHKNSILY